MFLEAIFIRSNIMRLSDLHGELAKRTLKEDSSLIENLLKISDTEEQFHSYLKDVNKRVTIIQLDGKVIYDSMMYELEESMDYHSKRPEVLEALEKGTGFDIRYSNTLKNMRAYYSVVTRDSDGEDYIVRTSLNYEREYSEIKRILLYELLFFLTLNIFIYFCYKNYLKGHLFLKIEEIRKTLEEGAEVTDIYSKGDLWISEFWKIVSEWQKTNLENMKQLELDKERLKRIISSVDMSILLIDESLNTVMKNDALNFLYRGGDQLPYYREVKHIEIIDIIKKCVDKKVSLKEEVYISELKKYLLVAVKYLKLNKQYILTVKDITRNKEMLEVQKNFISNISHELKTPLTNIKGYLIALEDAPGEMKDYFLNVAKNNVDKLENITMDFLNISKLENSRVVNLTPVSFEKLKEDVERSIDGILTKKNGRAIYSVNLLDENGYMKVDFDKFTTILKNLMENGVIYNDKEEPVVKVDIMELYDHYKVTVTDNGMGIPETETDNIFDRFYRVDKARTSNVAGTGLGLSIVAEMIDILGGKLKLKSEEGKGSTFTFTMLK